MANVMLLSLCGGSGYVSHGVVGQTHTPSTYRTILGILFCIKVLVVLEQKALNGRQVLGADGKSMIAIGITTTDVVPPAIQLNQIQTKYLCANEGVQGLCDAVFCHTHKK